MSVTEIPKIADDDYSHEAGKPAWIPTQDTDGNPLKPIVRCNCGVWCGIGLHHVHADGTVTASFYHSKGTNLAIGESPEGCGWHAWLKFLNYDLGEFPPRMEPSR